MRDDNGDRHAGHLPASARWLGYAGLLPQAAAAAVVASRSEWRYPAITMAYAYSALILSFLGGLWWGLAARQPANAPGWTWVAAVAPSLIALASAAPWVLGGTWPGPSLVLVGTSILASVVVDYGFQNVGLAPEGWIGLRAPLSICLGFLTIAIALLQ